VIGCGVLVISLIGKSQQQKSSYEHVNQNDETKSTQLYDTAAIFYNGILFSSFDWYLKYSFVNHFVTTLRLTNGHLCYLPFFLVFKFKHEKLQNKI